MASIKASQDAGDFVPAETSFDAYELDVSLFDGVLAAYVVGRLMQRLAWHHQQWVVLTAEMSCEHQLPPDDRRVDDEEYPRSERSLMLQQILMKIESEAENQRVLARKVADQLPGAIGRLPTTATDPLVRRLETLTDLLFVLNRVELADEALNLTAELRRRADDDQLDQIREEGLAETVKRHSLRKLDDCSLAITQILSERLHNYFRVGQAVERGLCPDGVFRHMTMATPGDVHQTELAAVRNLPDGVASSAGFVLAIHSFQPGSLNLSTRWRTQCKHALQTVDAWQKELFEECQLGRSAVKPLIGTAKDEPRTVVIRNFTC